MPTNRSASVLKTKARRRDLLLRYKQNVGCRCGEHRPECLDFHHRDPATKSPKLNKVLRSGRSYTGGSMWVDLSYTELVEEIRKCDVVCSNCHRVQTAIDRGWKRPTVVRVNHSPNLRAAEIALGL